MSENKNDCCVYCGAKKVELKVRVTTEHNGMPEGSVVRVYTELKYSYKGIWSSMMGTYPVKVLKKYSEIKK